MTRFVLLCVLVCGIAACGPDGDGGDRSDSAPDRFALANATYSGVFAEPITLTNGAWEGEPYPEIGAARPRVTLVPGFRRTGDLDGDGADEAVVLLAESSGGSGTFQHLAVVANRGEKTVNLGTARVGDRVQTVDCRVEDGAIVMDVVQAGPGDAMCCPTQTAHRTWRLRAGVLEEVAVEVTGTLSIVMLEGTEWVLDAFTWTEPAPEDPEVTITFDNGRAAGNGGCNRYFADVEESSPGEITFGEIGATQMSCPEEKMAVERRYHQALEGVTSYSFIAGRLALAYYDDGAMKTMQFRRR